MISILKTIFGSFLSDERDDFDTTLWNLDQLHEIHHTQNNTSRDSGTLGYKSRFYEASAPNRERRCDGNPHNEDHCHEYSLMTVALANLEYFRESKNHY